jgi:hypothetical protein
MLTNKNTTEERYSWIGLSSVILKGATFCKYPYRLACTCKTYSKSAINQLRRFNIGRASNLIQHHFWNSKYAYQAKLVNRLDITKSINV